MRADDRGSDAPVEDTVALVAARVPELAGQRTVTLLSGGITNQNFRVDVRSGRSPSVRDVGDASYVLRLGGASTELLGIDRAREHACARAAQAAGIGPDVIAFVPEYRALVTRFVEGRVLQAADMRHASMLRRAASALRRFHDGAAVPGRFSAFATVRAYHALATERGLNAPDRMGEALGALARLERALEPEPAPCPCHADLLPANFIDAGDRLVIIDWEYASMGDRFFDLGNLAVNHGLGEAQERALLEAYFGAARDADLRRLRLMRLVSDMREALWGYLQSRISTLEFDFLGYGREHLARFLVGYEAAADALGAAP
jgi:thiamine kinase-like enzyme